MCMYNYVMVKITYMYTLNISKLTYYFIVKPLCALRL